MKKMLTVLLCLGFFASLNAQDAKKTLELTVKAITSIDVKAISMDEIKSVPGVYLAVLEDNQMQAFSLYSSKDGKSIWMTSPFYRFAQDADNDLMVAKQELIEEMNQKVSNAKLDKVFNSLPKEGFVNINAKIKTDKLLTIVTEPDCPYCRNELKSLKEHLKTTNVRLVFASVHDSKAFIKAKFILDETKKINPNDSEKIIAVFEKYYQDIPLSEDQMKTDFSIVEQTTAIIFGSGIIRGVPYKHEGMRK